MWKSACMIRSTSLCHFYVEHSMQLNVAAVSLRRKHLQSWNRYTSFEVFCSVKITFECWLITEIPSFSSIVLSKSQSLRSRPWINCTDGFASFKDFIEYLPGEDNLWPGILSRWMPKPSKARMMALRASITPLLEKDFSWPSIFEMQQCQEQSSPGSLEMTSSDGVLMFMHKVWVPDAKRLRICIMWHCGVAAHLSFQWTKTKIPEYFLWESFEEEVKSFCGRCLHCRLNDKPFIPQPIGEPLHRTAPNHMFQHVQIVKDDFSGFV